MTAEELLKQDKSGVYSEQDITHLMIKFAKIHVKEALKASNLVKGNHISTLDCYPLENIK